MLLLKRLVRALPLLLLSPVLMAVSFVTLLLTDVLGRMWGGPPVRADPPGPAFPPMHDQADGGVGRGPGGPPHGCYFAVTSPTLKPSTVTRGFSPRSAAAGKGVVREREFASDEAGGS